MGVACLTGLRGSGLSLSNARERAQQQLPSSFCQTVQDAPCRVFIADRGRVTFKNWPGVQPLFNEESVRVDSGFPRHQGTLHGGCAAVCGQRREMQVHPPVGQQLKCFLRQ